MKRAELEAKMTGVENAKEIIDFVMSEYGKAVADNQTELKKYKEGGEFYIAPDKLAKAKEADFEAIEKLKNEHKELAKYKADQIASETKKTQTESIKETLKGAKYDDKVIDLLTREALEYGKFGEDNKLENGDELFGKIGEKYSHFKVTEKEGGFVPANTDDKKTDTDPFAIGFNSVK